MQNKVGPPVEGDDFFGREKELSYVWSKIKGGNNIILPSPRRVGKSSFAKELLKKASQSNWQILEINLEKVHTEVEFIELFISKLKELTWWNSVKKSASKITKSLGKLKPSLEVEGHKFSIEWEGARPDVYGQFEGLLDHKCETLIFLDELGVFTQDLLTEYNNVKVPANFLHWLRDLRQVSNSKIRWIICSSVGIQNFTHIHRITDTINDLLSYKLKVFNEEESIELLRRLNASSDVELPDEIFVEVTNKLDYCLPFFLQVMFQKLESLVLVDNKEIDDKLVELAYQEILTESHLNTWIERIDDHYGELSKILRLLLNHVCSNKKGVERDELSKLLKKYEIPNLDDELSNALYILINDGYLFESGNRYLFRSPLLRDFWFERFIK